MSNLDLATESFGNQQQIVRSGLGKVHWRFRLRAMIAMDFLRAKRDGAADD
jgi:hypothetical protein